MSQIRAAITSLGRLRPRAGRDQRRPREVRSTPPTSGSARAPASASGTTWSRARPPAHAGRARRPGLPGAPRHRRRRGGPHHRGHRHARTCSSPPPPASCRTRSRPPAPGASTSPPPAPASSTRYTMGAQFIQAGAHKKVLVIGADVMTSILDYKDRTTCVLFGDAAGAVLLEPSTGRHRHPRLRQRGGRLGRLLPATCRAAAA